MANVVMALAFASSVAPASAAYCGKPADTAALETYIVAGFHRDDPTWTGSCPAKPVRAPSGMLLQCLDRTWIGRIDVEGEYATAEFNTKGVGIQFYERTPRGWRIADWNVVPATATMAFKRNWLGCANPHFVPHGMG